MNFANLRSVLSTPWAIHPGHGDELLQTYVNHAQIGGHWTPREELTVLELIPVAEDGKMVFPNNSIALTIGAKQLPVDALATFLAAAPAKTKNNNGFVAKMHVNGPLMKYGDFCTYGMDEMSNMVEALKADPNVIGLISIIDSPGGMIGGLQNFSSSILNFGKPTIAYINDGIAASAAYWYAVSHDKVYTSSSTSEVGSIGVLCTLQDNTKMLEDNGVKRITVYSRLSPDKNKPVVDALQGDTTLLKDNLDLIAAEFHKVVNSRRKITDPKVLDGAMYISAHAYDLGMTDGTKTLDEAIAEIKQMAGNTSTTGAQNNTGNTGNSDNNNIDDMTPEEVQAIVNTAVGEAVTAAVAPLNQAIEGLTSSLQTATETISTMETTIETLEGKLAGLEEPGAPELPKGEDPGNQKKPFEPTITDK